MPRSAASATADYEERTHILASRYVQEVLKRKSGKVNPEKATAAAAGAETERRFRIHRPGF